MKVQVRTFARYRELLGFECLELPLPEPPTLEALLADPRLVALPQDALMAVNRAFVGRDARISSGDEVALMPPVSGG